MTETNLYNALHGYNPMAATIIASLRHAADGVADFPRYRDAYYAWDNDGVTPLIVVLTRTGGGNRDGYQAENAAITRHQLYLRDHDDDFDSTFALWYFRVPTGDVGKVRAYLATTEPQPTLKEKSDAAVARIAALLA